MMLLINPRRRSSGNNSIGEPVGIERYCKKTVSLFYIHIEMSLHCMPADIFKEVGKLIVQVCRFRHGCCVYGGLY